MPRPKNIAPSDVYHSLSSARSSLKERADCAVCAVTAIVKRPYEEVHEVMRNLGRRHGKGTPMAITKAALHAFGFRVEPVPMWFFMCRRLSPQQLKKQAGLTTHSADRHPGLFMKGEQFLIVTASGGHISAIVDGVNCDWSRGRSLRVTELWAVVPA